MFCWGSVYVVLSIVFAILPLVFFGMASHIYDRRYYICIALGVLSIIAFGTFVGLTFGHVHGPYKDQQLEFDYKDSLIIKDRRCDDV